MSARTLAQAEAEIRWLLPGVNYPTKRTYGISSMKVIRHCLLDEPLNPQWERPLDEHDLAGVRRTVAEAPPHLAEKAQVALTRMTDWLRADRPGAVERADRILAAATTGSGSAAATEKEAPR